jgi:hypothetical protein
MSKERAREFFERLQIDEELRGSMKEGLENLAKKAGFHDVTHEDLNEALRELWNASNVAGPPYSEPPGL